MWNKIYLIALAVSLLAMTLLTFYSYNWLSSIDAPVNVVQNYEYFSGIAWAFLLAFVNNTAGFGKCNVLENSKILGFMDDVSLFCFFRNYPDIFTGRSVFDIQKPR
jgi:Na+-driven multidrug efflux pump